MINVGVAAEALMRNDWRLLGQDGGFQAAGSGFQRRQRRSTERGGGHEPW